MNTLILLGNGFDKSLDFKTGYNDFYEKYKSQLSTAENNGNELCKYILSNIKSELWSDLENGLYQYSINLTANYGKGNTDVATKFQTDFNELRQLLFDYLNTEIHEQKPYNKQLRTISLYSMWYKFFVPLLINYTYTQNVLINIEDPRFFYNNNDSINENKLVFQHGALYSTQKARNNDPKDIVLGIDNRQQVEELHAFLYKSKQKRHNLGYLKGAINKSNTIIVFGCSAGDSDRCYFENIFNNTISDKTFLLYAYKEDGINNLKTKIENISGSLNNFEYNNHVEYIDNSTEDVIEITQEIINNQIDKNNNS